MTPKTTITTANQLFEKGIKQYDAANFLLAIETFQEVSPLFQSHKVWDKKIKSQDLLACSYMLLGKHKEAQPILIQNIEEANLRLGSKHLLTSNAYNSLGYCYGEQGDYDLQLEHYQMALSLLQEQHGEIHSQIATCYNNIGYSYSQKGYYEKALTYTKKALKIRLELHGELHPLTAQSYNNIGASYNMEIGDTEKGLLYYQKALAIRLQILNPTHPSIGVSYGNLGICHEKKKDYKLALQYKQKALEIDLKNFGENHPSTALNYNNIGHTHKLMGNLAKSMEYTKRSLNLRLKTLGEKHPLTATSFMNVGLLFGEAKEHKLEVEYLQQALSNQLLIFEGKHPSIALTHLNLGKAYGKWKQPLQKLNHLQQALQNLINNYEETDIYQIPTLEGYSDSRLFIETLQEKAKAFRKLFKTFKQVKDLEASVRHFQAALQLLALLRQSFKEEGSKLLLAQQKQGLFEQTIEASVLLLKHLKNPAVLQAAFSACEQSKAVLLLSNLTEAEAKASVNIPPELLQKEQDLKVELTYLDKSMARLKAKNTTAEDVLFRKFQNQYFDYKQVYDSLIEQFEQEYPAYFQLKYATQLAKLEEIQTYLQQQETPTALISYFIGGKKIYIFTSNLTHSTVKEVAKPDLFQDWIIELQDAIQLMDLEDFIENAQKLYSCLLAPIENQIGGNKKLIILRHNELEYLPFEILLKQDFSPTSNLAFTDLPYLLHDFEICYHYSATLFLNSTSKNTLLQEQPHTFLGLAPVTFSGEAKVELALESKRGKNKVLRSNRAGEQALAQLPNTETEVKEVYQLFQEKELDAKAFLFGSASKENLLSESSKHKFILISTHGFVEDEEAGLSGIYLAGIRGEETGDRNQESVLNTKIHEHPNTQTPKHTNSQTHKPTNTQTPKQPLYTSDAYHLQLNADLVVLSSCSSGIGKLQKGEGMMAMNRAFLSAGANNIVFTQFDIPDKSSSLLVKVLFQYILEGESYPSALRRAKLEVIQQAESSPQDWAGYVLIGS